MKKYKTCPNCNHKLEKEIKVSNYKRSSVLINVLVCNKCEKIYAPLKEAEKARLILNPTLFEKIKRFKN